MCSELKVNRFIECEEIITLGNNLGNNKFYRSNFSPIYSEDQNFEGVVPILQSMAQTVKMGVRPLRKLDTRFSGATSDYPLCDRLFRLGFLLTNSFYDSTWSLFSFGHSVTWPLSREIRSFLHLATHRISPFIRRMVT